MKEKFILKAKNIHNNKYDYSKLIYTKLNVKGIIICPIHGDFVQNLHAHIYQKQGCPQCGIDKRSSIRKTDISSFIEKSNKVHDNKYDYSLVEYKNNYTKVKIICPIHGEFEQVPKDHIRGIGCYDCSGKKRLNFNNFTDSSNIIHDDKYDYSLVEYKNGQTKIEIICPTHGSFFQTPENHKNRKAGCPKCNFQQSSYEKEIYNLIKEKKPDINIQTNIKLKEIIMNTFQERIKDKPITLLSPYIKSNEKIKVRCNICSYEWKTLPYVLYRSGCPQCANQIKPTIDQFKEKLFNINPDLEVLSEEYKSNQSKINVKCKKCFFEFEAKPLKLLSNNSVCQNCSSRLNKPTHLEYVDKFEFNEDIELIGEHIDYNTKIEVKCKKCNHKWDMLPSNLNRGSGCPRCFKKVSSYEDELFNIYSAGLNIERNKRFNNYEIDLFFPDYKFGIEFHGLYWHSDKFKEKNYHKNKYLKFKEDGIQIIQIFENEWIQKKNIILSIIGNKLGLNKKIYARQCDIRDVSIEDAKLFCEENHIQGYSSSAHKIGLYYHDILVSLITLRQNRFSKESIQEIVRFCNKLNTTVIGGFDKLLSYVGKELGIEELISYVDIRYFSGSSYDKYKFVHHTDPNYYYFRDNINLYNRMSFQKHKLKNKLQIYDEDLSEYENMIRNGFLRIYDGGQLKFLINL